MEKEEMVKEINRMIDYASELTDLWLKEVDTENNDEKENAKQMVYFNEGKKVALRELLKKIEN